MALEGKSFSHYRILQLIGKGGMGEVYLLKDLRVQRQVAAKFIRIEEMQSEPEEAGSALRLFWREATAIAQLDHPTILPLYDHGEEVIDGASVAYLIMPYRPEGSLTAWLQKRAREQQTRQLALKQITHMIEQASQSLQYVHDHGVMHLDVKPANFLVRSRSAADDYPDLLLSDFGIARLATMTSHFSQNVRGTPTYMAPEQCNGQPTFASDQYALAIMAYELLSGSPPFQGTPMSVMFAQVHQQPASICACNPLLPAAVEPVLQRALAKRPEERFPSIAAFAREFHHAFQGINEATTLRVLSQSTATSTPGASTPPGDIRATLAISAEEARNGTVRTLTLANGRTVSVQIPPGSQPDQVLILIGQGEVLGPGGTAGNLYLTLSVVEAPVQVPPVIRETVPAQQIFPVIEKKVLPAQDTQPTSSLLPAISTPRPIASGRNAGDHRENISSPIYSPTQDGITLPPSSPAARSKRQRPHPFGIFLFILILMIFGGTMYGSVTNHWPWNIAEWPFISQHLNAITWSGSQFVAVGDTILTSPDGHTWTAQNTGSSDLFKGVAGSGSQFVAVGDSIVTSPDGHTWTSQSASTSSELYAVAGSGSQFVAVGYSSILTSPDGQSWSTV